MNQKILEINTSLASRLIDAQFPEWRDLPIRPVASSGWDNRTFHLGEQMLIRMPSSADYALQVEKEQHWLPKLARFLPLLIPTPIAMGEPGEGYPWKWSIYRWLDGESASSGNLDNLNEFASTLAQFLIAFESIDSTGGPAPGLHSFYRGGSLANYDAEVRRALHALRDKIDITNASAVWDNALRSHWQEKPVWVHGDISAGNLLVRNGKLIAVIDFGQLTVGDPACDLAITWTLFQGESRAVFQALLNLDADTWARARGWTLWKALVVAAGFTNPGNAESERCWQIIDEVIRDKI